MCYVCRWFVVALIFAFIGAATAGEPQSSTAAYAVALHCGQPVPLDTAIVPEIDSWALALVRSSQGNSEGPKWVFPMSEVEQEYRDALTGDYLRVDLASVATITTLGGPARVSAIVVRLNPHSNDWRSRYPDHFVDSLFTINENGVVVGHALYSGQTLFGLFGAIGRALAVPYPCKREEDLFVRELSAPDFPSFTLRE